MSEQDAREQKPHRVRCPFCDRQIGTRANRFQSEELMVRHLVIADWLTHVGPQLCAGSNLGVGQATQIKAARAKDMNRLDTTITRLAGRGGEVA